MVDVPGIALSPVAPALKKALDSTLGVIGVMEAELIKGTIGSIVAMT